MIGCESNGSGGIGFTSALTLLFIALKLSGVIDWSWLWVLSPTWIGILLGILVVIIIAGLQDD